MQIVYFKDQLQTRFWFINCMLPIYNLHTSSSLKIREKTEKMNFKTPFGMFIKTNSFITSYINWTLRMMKKLRLHKINRCQHRNGRGMLMEMLNSSRMGRNRFILKKRQAKMVIWLINLQIHFMFLEITNHQCFLLR